MELQYLLRDALVKHITLLYPQHPSTGHSATGLLDVFIGESGCWNASCFCCIALQSGLR